MKCSKIQEKILQFGEEEFLDHIEVCEDCRGFLKTFKMMGDLKNEKVPCPLHLTFKDIKNASGKTILFPFRISKIALSLTAAAILLVSLWFPDFKSGYMGNEKITAYAYSSMNITSEIDELDEMVEDMENLFYMSESIMEMEMDSIYDEIDNFIFEEV